MQTSGGSFRFSWFVHVHNFFFTQTRSIWGTRKCLVLILPGSIREFNQIWDVILKLARLVHAAMKVMGKGNDQTLQSIYEETVFSHAHRIVNDPPLTDDTVTANSTVLKIHLSRLSSNFLIGHCLSLCSNSYSARIMVNFIRCYVMRCNLYYVMGYVQYCHVMAEVVLTVIVANKAFMVQLQSPRQIKFIVSSLITALRVRV